MKQKKFAMPLFWCVTIFFSTLFFSCKKDKTTAPTCNEKTINAPASVNFFDFKTTSPFYNQVVANFKFNQSTKSYSGTASCPLMQCSTALIIQNVTAKKITFDYKITFTLNFAKWEYQGVALIDAGSSLIVGEISNNCASLLIGKIVLQSANISYQ